MEAADPSKSGESKFCRADHSKDSLLVLAHGHLGAKKAGFLAHSPGKGLLKGLMSCRRVNPPGLGSQIG